MKAIQRFKRLSTWNKVGVMGSIASIIGLGLYLFPSDSGGTAATQTGSSGSNALSIGSMNGSQVIISGTTPSSELPESQNPEFRIEQPSLLIAGPFLRLSEAVRFGPRIDAIVGNRTMPYAFIDEPPMPHADPTYYTGYYASPAYVVRFYASRQNQDRPAVLDSIEVFVHRFARLPEDYRKMLSAFPLEPSLYWADIAPPKTSVGQTFIASRHYERTDAGVVASRFSPIALDESPAPFDVRLNATEPGIYTVSVRVVATDGQSRETFTVLREHEVLFEAPPRQTDEIDWDIGGSRPD